MLYPQPLRKGDTIGICAPSNGIHGPFTARIDNALKQLKDLGYHYVETASARNAYKLTSAPAEVRAQEFLSLYKNPDIKLILPPWGGEFLMDMLPYLNFDEIAQLPPKWIMGFSDTSTLLFTLTLSCDMATVHGPNLTDFGPTPIDDSVLNALKILEDGHEFEQAPLPYFQKEWGDFLLPYQLTEKVEWKTLKNEKDFSFQGRLIGGNLDVICKLIGTPYDKVKQYSNKYAEDGIIWYFESCEMEAPDIYRTLWQMKMNGWFEGCNGFIFGRADGYSDARDFNLMDAYMFPLGDLNVPVIYDADLGHLPPQLVFINGALGRVSCQDGKFRIMQELR